MLIEAQGLVRGYCVEKSQEAILRAIGLTEKYIYCEGRGAETLAACIASFRGEPGTVIVAAVLESPMNVGGITIAGFSALQFDELSGLLDALSEASALRRLCALF